MRAVVQRVINASVTVDGVVKGSIDSGLLVYLGVASDDGEKDAIWLADKIVNLRILDDADGIMNLSVKDTGKKILVVSQFTLLADARKGRRPSWNGAASPEKARELYGFFISCIKEQGVVCEKGEFQARMQVNYTNEGPVTIILDSKE